MSARTLLLSRRDAVLIPLVAALWGGAVLLRDRVIVSHCLKSADACRASDLHAIDQMYVGHYDAWADHASFVTQYLAGILPLVVTLLLAWSRGGSLRERSKRLLTDWVILLELALVNGLVTELIRLTVQRPRPFVYGDPLQYGVDAAHYTSFVSGHTSFAAAMSLGLAAILLARDASRKWLVFAAINFLAWVPTTAYFRVVSGRHFITDTVGALVSASLVTFAVVWLHRKPVATIH